MSTLQAVRPIIDEPDKGFEDVDPQFHSWPGFRGPCVDGRNRAKEKETYSGPTLFAFIRLSATLRIDHIQA